MNDYMYPTNSEEIRLADEFRLQGITQFCGGWTPEEFNSRMLTPTPSAPYDPSSTFYDDIDWIALNREFSL